MAVYQISRIQNRRGRKLSQTGFPQLASAELGWAIDTQELYIGNGAVSEGAPYVGNTRVLTEHDDLLQFSTVYQYLREREDIQTGPTINSPIRRSLQQRLDDNVSMRSFGALANNIADDTLAIQRAINQLFLNDNKSNENSRVVLYFEPGIYRISDEIKIPPYVHIVGSGIDSTVILQTNSQKSIFKTVASNSTIGSYVEYNSMVYENRPRFMNISGLTLKLDTGNTNPIMYVDNVDSSSFSHIKFLGNYVNGGSIVQDTQAGVIIRGLSDSFRTNSVTFTSCIWNSTGYGVFSNTNHNNVSFENCIFNQLYDGINVGGGSDSTHSGSVNTKVTSCFFDLIDRYGFYVKRGYGNTSTNNKYMSVGNNNQGYAGATYSIIRFDDYTPSIRVTLSSGMSINDYFERNKRIKNLLSVANAPFISCVQMSGKFNDEMGFRKNIPETPLLPEEMIRLPVPGSGTYVIDYVINKTASGTAVRSGSLHITIESKVGSASVYSINDQYNYSGSSTVENMVFSVSLRTYTTGLVTGVNDYPDTMLLLMTNPSTNGIGTFNCSYYMMSK